MFFKLLLIFVLVPLVELTILIKLGQIMGLWPTLILVVFTGIAGAALAKREGVSVIHRIRADLANGILPGRQLVSGLLVLIGGGLLVTPGILTDIVGFILIIPRTRNVICDRVIKWLKRRIDEANFRFIM